MKFRFFDAFFALCVLFLLANLLIAVSACSNDESVRVIDDVILNEQGQAALSQGDSLKQGTYAKSVYVPNFACDKKNEGEMEEVYGPNYNQLQGNDIHYVRCVANEWVEISQEQYNCENDNKVPKVGDRCSFYDSKPTAFEETAYFDMLYFYYSDTGWVSISKIEYDKMQYACNSKNEGEKKSFYSKDFHKVVGGDVYYYRCQANEWVEISNAQYGCEDTAKVGDKCFFYEDKMPQEKLCFYYSDSGWVSISEEEYNKPNEVCDSANEGKKLETYGSGHNEKYGGDEHYYKCLANEWKEIEQVQYECEDETPKVGDKCVYHGGSVYFGSTYYAYYSDTGWVNINAIEYTFGFCTNEKESQVVNHEWYGDYICKSGKWTAVTEEAASED